MKNHHFILGIIVVAVISLMLIIGCGNATGGGGSGGGGGTVLGHFTDNSDGTITDNITGLMWVKDPSVMLGVWGTQEGSPSLMTWYNATIECDALNYAAHTDWRLPTLDELTTITAESGTPSIDAVFTNTKSDGYWSSTTYTGNTAYAWGVYFDDGHVSNGPKGVGGLYVRPVRSP